jgi:branched-subunit amino acid transport protein
MTATVWITIGGLALATAVIKGFGPVIFGGRDLHAVVARVIPLLAPALLAALVVTETVGGHGRTLTIDARVAGVTIAAITLAMRAPLVVVVLSAAVATAVVRAVA